VHTAADVDEIRMSFMISYGSHSSETLGTDFSHSTVISGYRNTGESGVKFQRM
jgi:hypothetical protein